MPKKTKREKILAEARRIIREAKSGTPVPRSTTNVPAPDHEIAQTSGYHFAPIAHKEPTRQQVTSFVPDDAEFTAIRKNLIKTILIASGALAVEFVLYWKFRAY
jgi:hypothetical protein